LSTSSKKVPDRNAWDDTDYTVDVPVPECSQAILLNWLTNDAILIADLLSFRQWFSLSCIFSDKVAPLITLTRCDTQFVLQQWSGNRRDADGKGCC
jgi:hypothetical protein